MSSLQLARLRGRLRPLDPTLYSIGPTFLRVTCDEANNVVFFVTQASGANDEEYRLLKVGTATWDDPVNLENVQNTAFETPNVVYWAQVRGINGANKGPWSNICPFITAGPKAPLISWGVKTIQSTTAGAELTDVDLTSLDFVWPKVAAGALQAVAGDFCVNVGFYGHGAVASAQGVQGSATGWDEREFENQAAGGVQYCGRILDKVLDGTEAGVDVFDEANAATATSRRHNYHAMVFRPAAGSVVTFLGAFLSSDTGNPAAQVIPAAGAGGVVIAIAIIASSAANAQMAFNAYSGASNYVDVMKDTTGATAPVLNSLCRVKIFDTGETPANITMDPSDFGNNVFGWVLYSVTKPE